MRKWKIFVVATTTQLWTSWTKTDGSVGFKEAPFHPFVHGSRVALSLGSTPWTGGQSIERLTQTTTPLCLLLFNTDSSIFLWAASIGRYRDCSLGLDAWSHSETSCLYRTRSQYSYLCHTYTGVEPLRSILRWHHCIKLKPSSVFVIVDSLLSACFWRKCLIKSHGFHFSLMTIIPCISLFSN